MVLGFLRDISGVASTVGDVAQTFSQFRDPVSQIVSAVRGPRDVPQVDPIPVPAAESQASELLSTLADPDSPLLQQIQRQEFESLAQALSQGIRGQVLAGRREESLGRRRPFFDPERQDESIAFQLSRGLPALQQRARENAINRILTAAGVGQFAPAQAERIRGDIAAQAARQTEVASREQQAGTSADRFERGLGGLEELLKELGGLSTRSRVPIPPVKPQVPQSFISRF